MKLIRFILTFISFLFFIPFAFCYRITQAFYTNCEKTMNLFDIEAIDSSMIRRKARDHEAFIAKLEAAEEAARTQRDAEEKAKLEEEMKKSNGDAAKKKEAARKRKAREAAKKKNVEPKKKVPKKVEPATKDTAEGDDF